MDEKLLIKKIQALLHDPPEKPIILGRIGHEGRAREIMKGFIDDARIPDDVKTADHVASASDRINLPKNERFIADFRANPVIMHPLSGKEFDLKSLKQVDIKDITNAVDRTIVYLADKYKNNNEQIYLALWRELVELLKKSGEGSATLGQLWELLPADTRIPDHSIWEHKRVTSAIAGALPKPAFLLFAIGPVQDFIATARKTQDLWAGSYLLSYLSWSAMKVVAEEFGPDSLIFPDLCEQPFADLWLIEEKRLKLEKPNTGREKLSSPTLPNRFLAVVPSDSVENIAKKAKKQVIEIFKSVCQAVKEKMAEKCGVQLSTEWENIWQRQTADFIEIYWAATSFDDVKDYTGFISDYKQLMGVSDNWEFDDLLKQYEKKGYAPNIGTAYGQIYRLTEKTLGSRKAVRDFSQQGEPNHKCTLCGVREPVHPGMYNGKNCGEEFGALKGFWQDKIMPAFPQIKRSERLCSVCSTKRFAASYFFREKLGYDISNAFPSVSIIATASFKEKIIKNLENPELYMRVNEFINHLEELFRGNESRMNGESLRMVYGMCFNKNTVSMNNRELALNFASLEGDWLYEDSFRDSLKDELANFPDDALGNARKYLHSLIKAAKKLGIDPPSKYYAVIRMDGDDMGKWLSGEIAPTIKEILHPTVRNTLDHDTKWSELLKQKRPLNPSLHLVTSKALRDFSLHVAREIVEKDHLGKLVYAGGDDVLAFVNLRDLTKMMEKLRAYFSGSLKVDKETNKVDIDFKDGSGFIPIDDDGIPLNVGNNEKKIKGFMLSMGTNATASMGVVIAHHNSNLSQRLDDVRDSEKKAKKLKDKNAFCIALAKRSGGTEHIGAKWYYEFPHFEKGGQGRIFESIPLLRKWADAFYNGHLSPKIVYTFRTETVGLEGLPAPAIKHELLRIANRQRDEKAKDFDEDKMEKLVDGIMNLHAGGLSLDDISKFLSVAAFLGREGNR